ncbi:MAG: HYR domain-containing protein [Lentimicrobium sp.]
MLHLLLCLAGKGFSAFSYFNTAISGLSVIPRIAYTIIAFILTSLNISAQEHVTLSLPLTSGEKGSTPYNIASFEFAYGSAIDTVFFDPAYGAMSGGWNSSNLNPEAYYEYRIAPDEGASLSLSQVRIDISLGRGEMRTAVNYSTDGFRSEGLPMGRPVFFTTTTPRTLPLTTGLTISYPDTLSIRVYAWGARDRQISFNNRNVIIAATASGPQLLAVVENLPPATEPKPSQPETQTTATPAAPEVVPATDTTETGDTPVPEEPSVADANMPVKDSLVGGNNGIIMAPMVVVPPFTTPGTNYWTCPVGVTCIKVEAWGGGGRGGNRTNNGAGGGGGGGGYSQSAIWVTPGNTYTVYVGAGSTSTAAGEDSWFNNNTTLLARGGNSVNNNTTGGATGGALGTGNTLYLGGNGAAGYYGSGTDWGGGGGSSSGNQANGNNGNNQNGGIAPAGGGNGGNGRYNTQGNGTAGSSPGGGGGGGLRSSSGTRTGGNGANGQVIITYIVIYNITQSGNNCGGPVTIGLSGSEAGVSYQLYLDGVPLSGAVTGDGSAISFGNHSTAGTYTVGVTGIDVGTCSTTMNGSVVINPVPTITPGSNPSVCRGVTSANLLYSATTGSPDQYSIDYNPAAEAAGFVDVINSVLPASPIILAIPAGAPSALYSANLTVRNSTTGCTSTAYPISVTVNPLPVAPTAAASDRNNFCADDSGNISLSVTGGSGTTVRWFTGSCGGADIGTGNPLNIASPVTTTTYYARWETSECGFSACSEITVTVRPIPVAPTSVFSNINNICVNAGGTITLTAVDGSGTTLRWFTGSCGGTAIGTGISLTIPSPIVTTTYYARWENDCGNSTCASTTVTVIQLPISPSSAASNSSGFCADDVSNITLTATGGSGTTLRWYTGSCGGTEIGNVNPLTIASPAVTTTYYARWENSCGVSTCAEVTVDVIPLPVAPTSVSVDRNGFCYDDAGNIILTASGGSGDQLEWFTGSCGGTLIGTGNNLSIASPAITTTYYVFWTNVCGSSSCQSVTVSVNVVTPGAIATGQTICNGGDPAMITSTTPGTGMGNITYRWESAISPFTVWNPIAGAIGATYDPPAGLTETTHYRRITVSDYNGGCESEPTTALVITVQSIATAGTIAEDQYVCFGGSTTPLYSLVDGTGDGTITYRWERSVTPFTVWTTIAGATAATYNPGPLAFTTQFRRYTVSTLNGIPCESIASNVITITIQDVAVTAGSIGNDQTICYNDIPDNLVSLVDGTATAGAVVTYEWQINTGTWVTIPGENNAGLNISTPHAVTTSYRRRTVATLAGNSCFSQWTVAVTITVIRPVTPGSIAASQTICNGATPAPLISVTAGTSPGATITYQWEQSTNGGTTWTIAATGAPAGYAPGPLTQTTWLRRITVATMNGHVCYSEPTNTVIITVQDVVQPGSIAASQTICYGATPAPLTSVTPGSGSSAPAYSWEYSINNGATWILVAGANLAGYAPGALLQTTWFRRITTCTVNGVNCTAPSAHVVITVQGQVIPPVASANQTICHNTTPALLNRTNASGGSGSFTYQWQSSTDNVNFINVGASGLTYQPPALTQTTYYRVAVTDATCGGPFYSNVLTITVRPELFAPSICCDQVVCIGASPDPLNGIPASGGSNTFTYQWQWSADGNPPWNNIAGANNPLAYNPPSQSRFYRLVATDICGTVISNVVEVSLGLDFGGSFSTSGNPSSAVCPGYEFTYHIESASIGALFGRVIRYSWTADPAFVSPPSGGPVGVTSYWWIFPYFEADIPFTVYNTTNLPVTTTVTIIPGVYANPGPPGGALICNLSPRTFNVTINPFRINCPGNYSVNTDNNLCSASVSISDPTFIGSCLPNRLTWTMTGATIGSSPATGINNIGTHIFNIGTTIITYTAINSDDVVTTCSFTVTVTDNQEPTLTCPANISRTTDLNQCAASVATPNPTFSDNCGGAGGVTFLTWNMSGATSGTSPATGINYLGTQTFNPGITTIIYTAGDAYGNRNTCSFTVTITDNQAPNFTSCPSNYNVSTDNGACNATFDPTDPVVTDNCYSLLAVTWTMTGATTGSSPVTGINFLGSTTFNTGTTTITYRAADPGGNTATCEFTVTVTDNELPQFVFCPSGYSVNSEPGRCYATITTQDPEVFDNCGISALTWSITGATTGSGSGNIGAFTFNTGTSTVVYTLSDNSTPPHTSVCTYDVTVTDTQMPTMSCPTAQTRNTDPGVCSYTASGSEFDPVNIVENCPGYTLSNNYNGGSTLAGAIFPLGTTTVRWVLIDAGMNSTECYIAVTIVDNQAPVITSCAPPQTASAGAGCQAAVPDVRGMIVVSDNCTNTGNLAIAQSPVAGSMVGIGVTNITITVRDENGLATSCQTTFTVSDNTAPVFTDCPANPIVLPCNPSTLPDAAMAIAEAGTVTDNCGTPSVNATGGTITNTGCDYTQSWNVTASDGSNTSNCLVTFNWTQDNTVPVIITTAANGSLGCNPTVTAPVFTGTDNCEGSITPVVTTAGPTHTGCDYSQTWTANYTDACGNSATPVSITYTWTQDTEVPVITTTAVSENLGCNPTVTVPVFTGTDNCEGTITPVVNTAGPTISGCDYSQSWTATYTDACGNVAPPVSISFSWTEDTTPPTIICPDPDIITVEADAGETYASDVPVPTPVVSDNCGTPSLTWVTTDGTSNTGAYPADNQFNIGTTVITWTVTDGCGNHVSTCTFTVIVEANDPPDITCAADVTLDAAAGLCAAVVNPAEPTVNAGDPVSWSWEMTGAVIDNGTGPIDDYTFPVGTTTITWTATNASGTDVCIQTITIEDDQAPTFTAPGPFNYCVINIISALYDGQPEPDADIVPEFPNQGNPRRPDWYLVSSGSTELDLTGVSDNCCDEEDISISWIITFDPLTGYGPISGTGQPSLNTPIQLWGTFTNVEVNHTISYTVTDCNGNPAITLSRNILIRPRPHVIKQ